MKPTSHIRAFIVFGGYFLLGLFAIFHFKGTGDNADSVMHYLIARHAPDHPKLFFDHWGKPVFTILASPFAQLGFHGIKLFNLVVTVASAFLTYVVAKRVGIKNAWVAGLIMLACPFGFVVALSGLTEPLFGLFTIVGLMLLAQQRNVSAATVISFLPFVRSEGLLILGVFGLLFLIQRNWKAIAALLAGHFAFGLLGWYHHGTPLWVITRIPYATTDSVYGSGSLFSMVDRLYFVIGIPVAVLLVLGAISIVPRIRCYLQGVKATLLVALGCILAMLVFHTLAWYLGMFNSMGLKRVFVASIPCIGVIGLVGFNLIHSNTEKLGVNAARVVFSLMIIALIGFPFTSNNTALHTKDLEPWLNQRVASQMVFELYPNGIPEGKTVFYSAVFYGEILNVDPFDPDRHRDLNLSTSLYAKSGDIILWDTDTPLHQNGLTLEQVGEMQTHLLRSYKETSEGKTHELHVFEVI